MTLALMLATHNNFRGLALGIALAVGWSGPMQVIGQPMQKYAPWLDMVLPWRLLMPNGNEALVVGYPVNSQPAV